MEFWTTEGDVTITLTCIVGDYFWGEGGGGGLIGTAKDSV